MVMLDLICMGFADASEKIQNEGGGAPTLLLHCQYEIFFSVYIFQKYMITI